MKQIIKTINLVLVAAILAGFIVVGSPSPPAYIAHASVVQVSNNDTGVNGGLTVKNVAGTTVMYAQSFNATSNVTISTIDIHAYRTGSPGTGRISFYNSNNATANYTAQASTYPTGSALTYATFDVDAITTNTSGAWYRLFFNTPFSIIAGTRYDLVASIDSVGTGELDLLYHTTTGNNYRGGTIFSKVNAGAWTYADFDWNFVLSSDTATNMVYTATRSNGAVSGNVTFYGDIVSLASGNATEWGIQYGETTSYGTNITSTGSADAGTVFSESAVGFVIGTTYHYRAMMYNASMGWVYGDDAQFTYDFAENNPVIATGQTILSATSANLTFTIQNLTTANATVKGIKIDTVTHILDNSYYWTESQSGNWGNGDYYDAPAFLTVGTTYYWKAFATVDNVTYYSVEQSFVQRWEPVITLYGGMFIGNNIAVSGTVNSTGTTGNVTSLGFLIGTATGNYTLPSVLDVRNYGVGVFAVNFGPYTPSQTYYIKAFASNGYYTGYSQEIAVGGNVTADLTGLTVTADGVYETTEPGHVYEQMIGTITNASMYAVTKVAFSWGTTANATGFGHVSESNEQVSNFQGTVSYTFDASENTTYYFKIGAWANNVYTWSNIFQFNSHTKGLQVTINPPTIRTLGTAYVTATSFVAYGEVVSLGDLAYIDYREIEISRDASHIDGRGEESSGNWSTGQFAFAFDVGPGTFLNGTSKNFYYRAGASGYTAANVSKGGFGAWRQIVLSGTGGSDNVTVGEVPPASDTFRRLLFRLGMDNLFGHWAAMALLMFIVMLIAILAALMMDDKLLKKIIIILGAAICVVIFGVFLFSGLLDKWSVFILVAFVSIVIGIFIRNKTAEGASA